MRSHLPAEATFEVLDFVPLGVFGLNSDLTVLFWNTCLEEWTHIPRQKIIGQRIDSYFPHLNQPKYLSRLHEIFEGGHPILFSSQLHSHLIPIARTDGQLQVQNTTITAIPSAIEGEFYALWSIQDVTDLSNQVKQSKAEQARAQKSAAALRESEERWQLALHGNNDGIWDWNIATNEAFFSHRWKEMLGFADPEISHCLEEWARRIHPDDLAAVTQAIQDHCDKNTPFYISEHRLQCKDGSYKWILDRGQAIWDETGKVVRMVGSHTDITERKQTEIALQESEAKYRNLIEHLNAGFIVHAPDTHILQCNLTACELLGLSMDQVLGKAAIDPAWHFLREDGTIMPAEEYPINLVLSTQAPFKNYVVGVNRADQTQGWALVTAFPEFDGQHQLKQVVVTFVDISPLKQAETELREMAGVMEHAISGISKLDAQGRYLYVNKAYADLVGYQPKAMIGMEWHRTVHPTDRKKLFAAYGQMQQDGKVEVEAQGVRRDGSSFYKQLVMIAAYNEQQQFVGHYCFMKDITERTLLEADRRRAEQALQESEARFQSFMNHSPAAAWITDSKGKILYLSQTYFRTFQVPPGNFIGQTIFELFGADVAQPLLENIQTVVHTQQALSAIELAPRLDGTIGDFLVYKFPIPDPTGQILVGGVAIDVTQKHQAEAALQHSEATKQAIIQAIPDLLMRMCVDGSQVEFISNSQFNLVNPDDYSEKANIYDVLPPSLAQLRMHHIQVALQSQTTQVYEQKLTVDGMQRYEEVRIVPLPQDEVLVMVRNVTDRKQAEIDLRHQKEMFQAIIDHIPVMIGLFNGEGIIQFINPELERVLGWSITDWQQRDLFVACYPDAGYRQDVIEHMLAATGTWRDFQTRNAAGHILETSWANVPLSNGHFLGIGQDISDRKRKEIALQQTMEAAEAANLAKSMFLANMSHELRTPLNVILGFAQVMAHDPTLSQGQKDDLQTIRRSGDHLLSLINDVLDLSKIEAGHCTLAENGFDLISLLHTLRTMMTERAHAKHLELNFDIAAEVPQFVIADEQKLRQILLNLLSNAIKFTKQGSVTLQVRTRAREMARAGKIPSSHHPLTLQFEVIDTGIGIAATEIDTIFDAFVQAEAGKQSISGTGLGLTISRNLLEIMNGTISVHSQPTVGSRFTVTVPVCPTSGTETQPEQRDRTVIGLVPGQPHRRILVVDDQRENRLLMVRLLARLGLEVQEATDGQAAISIWQRWQPDLTWMDIRMPGLDGYEATKQIRAMEQGNLSVIIALTAQASQSDRTLALAAGCNDYMSKPFREETVFLKLSEYLGLEYVYAEQPSSTEQLPVPVSVAPAPFCLLDPALVTPISAEWLQNLEDAAICGKDWAIVELARQLPADFTPLSNYLVDLADQFHFEQIVSWVHHSTRGDSDRNCE